MVNFEPNMPKGIFIVVEGGSRVGKTTLIKELVTFFTNLVDERHLGRFADRHEITTYSFPTPEFRKTKAWELMASDKYMDHCIEIEDALVKDRKDVQDAIKRKVARGEIVIADRWLFSGIAYAAASFQEQQNAFFARDAQLYYKRMVKLQEGTLLPDVIIFVTPPVNDMHIRDWTEHLKAKPGMIGSLFFQTKVYHYFELTWMEYPIPIVEIGPWKSDAFADSAAILMKDLERRLTTQDIIDLLQGVVLDTMRMTRNPLRQMWCIQKTAKTKKNYKRERSASPPYLNEVSLNDRILTKSKHRKSPESPETEPITP
jgi:thymidylate kinase